MLKAAAVVLAISTFARVTELEPKSGMQNEFEAGYKRHLEWHRSNDDKWSWLGWTIVTGERYGVFVDGTFDRTAADFDAPVKPADDAVDNARNVFPYADVKGTAFYRLRDDLSRGSTKRLRSPWAILLRVVVRPGREREFERTLKGTTGDMLCFALISGGRQPSYWIFFPAQSVSETLRDVLPMSDAIERAVSETVRFRPDMTYDADK